MGSLFTVVRRRVVEAVFLILGLREGCLRRVGGSRGRIRGDV